MGDKSDGLTFSLFSRVFFWFLITSSKNFEKTKMKQKIQISRLYKAKYLPQILFVFDFLFFDQKWPKPLRKPKSTQKKTKIRRLYEARHFPQIFVYCFLFFFGFLEVVATFGQKPKKNIEKTKKNKKNKKNEKNKKKQKKQKNQRLGDYMRPDISLKSLVFCFFWFFRFFWFFWFSRGFFSF